MPRTPGPPTPRGDIVTAIHAAGGDLTAAAASLGLGRQALYYRASRDPEIRRAIREARRRAQTVSPCPHCGGTGVTRWTRWRV